MKLPSPCLFRNGLLLALFLFSAQLTSAATLADLQKEAVGKRQVVERYKAGLEKSREEETIAKSRYLPSFDLSYTMNHLQDGSLYENRENSVAYGAMTWNLFRGFRDKYTIASAQLQRRADELRLEGIEQDIQLSVALKYLNIYSNKANLKLQEDTYSTLKKAHEDAQSRFEVGLIDKNELLRFKVELDNAFIAKKRAEAALANSVGNLGREIAGDVRIEELLFSEFDQAPQVDTYEPLKKTMFEGRSEIRVLEELAAAADLQVEASHADYYPKVDLSTSYRKYADDLRSVNGDTTSEEYRGQLMLSLNVFDGFRKRSSVHKAQLDSRIVRHDLAELKLDLANELENLLRDYAVSQENTEVSLSGIDQAEENLRITDLKYKEGLETETNLLDAIANLSRARFNHINANYEEFNNYYRITRAIEGF